jgi:hypothetical protein
MAKKRGSEVERLRARVAELEREREAAGTMDWIAIVDALKVRVAELEQDTVSLASAGSRLLVGLAELSVGRDATDLRQAIERVSQRKPA